MVKPIQYKPKPKKCKMCGTQFNPYTPLQMVCSPNCALEYNSEREVKKRVSKMKNDLEDSNFLRNKAQNEFNELIRMIDSSMPCISCGNRKYGHGEAGHYHSRGKNPTIFIHAHNIHLQDNHCNQHLSANIIGYDNGLINRYGKQYWEYVKFELPKIEPLHLTREDYKAIMVKIRTFKRYLQTLNLEGLTNSQRLELRNLLNERLGIYK
jgi:hypothetical protein